jgi:hypothetical protein
MRNRVDGDDAISLIDPVHDLPLRIVTLQPSPPAMHFETLASQASLSLMQKPTIVPRTSRGGAYGRTANLKSRIVAPCR